MSIFELISTHTLVGCLADFAWSCKVIPNLTVTFLMSRGRPRLFWKCVERAPTSSPTRSWPFFDWRLSTRSEPDLWREETNKYGVNLLSG